ncbi:MAG: shikimate dehydrogenase [Candidatus Gastranaerophilales bacterium]
MNEDLYNRYLEKKAKKLGISVEELKAQNATPLASNTSTSQQNPTTQPPISNASTNQTLQNQENNTTNVQYSFSPSSNIEKKEVPSHVFTTQKPVETLHYEQQVSNTYTNDKVEIKDTREKKFAIVGYPLGHSLSPVIHSAGFKSLGIDATYKILETPPENLVDTIKYLKTENFSGFNVTIPHKLPVSLFVDEVDNYADIARAVNTVSIEADKSLKAFNTDVIGFKRAIPNDIDLKNKKIAMLGLGGAAHAGVLALAECGVKEISFFVRNIPNSIDAVNYFRAKLPNITFNLYQIENIRDLGEYSMLVNTTPLGMLGKGSDLSPIDLKAMQTLQKDAVVYEIIYNPKKTVLIKMAEKLGLRTITGLDMFIYQAVAAQEIWFGRTPDFKDMKIAALEEL